MLIALKTGIFYPFALAKKKKKIRFVAKFEFFRIYLHIPRFICVSLYPRILASSYPKVHVCLLVSLHSHILISSGLCVLACILVSLHPDILRFMYACWYTHILMSSYLQVHIPLLASLHPHILRFVCACLYPCILTSSYPQVHVFLLVYLHPHILRFMCTCSCPHILASLYHQVYVCLLVCSHLQVNVFSIRMNNCILASSSSLVLGNCASQFVNNLQILWTGQAFVLDFYCMSRKIYQNQPLRADLKKKLFLKSRQNL